jgi:hypothetical protein
MLSLNFATRAQLERLGLSDADIESFITLRTSKGEVLPNLPENSGLSAEGLDLLKAEMASDDGVDRRLSDLVIQLRPAPPVATMEPMKVRVTHHGDIDRELRVFERSFLPHGVIRFTVFDVSHKHIVLIEILSATGLVTSSRAGIPPSDQDQIRDAQDYPDGPPWHVMPPLSERERWSVDEPEIYIDLTAPTHARPDIVPVTAAPRFDILRKGRFIVLGQPDIRLDGYSLAFGFPDASLFAKLPSLFGTGGAPHVAALQPGDPVLGRISEFLALEPGQVDFDGMFGIDAPARPGIGAPGWAWVLTGPSVFAGFQPDPQLYEPRPNLIITLPASGLGSGSGVPYNATERGILDRPELFGSDPGQKCQPFDQPGRILSERRFQTALRVTQPMVASAQPGTVSFEDVTKRPIDFPRDLVSKKNAIEYDAGDPSRYQALTVSIGHVLETAVRYRSNGYSLGDIAYSLTLAPRQKRRIVKVEFARSERAERREMTRADDEVSDAVDSSRSYDNAVSASLDEWAKGRSSASTTAAAAGGGFAMPGFVVGGGVASSTSKSASSQEGGRRTAAEETQQINDSIRRWGDALRTLQSTVVQEVAQTETVQGVSEVIQNINYTRSLSVIYYEILRHLRVDTEVAGVTECVFVPMPVKDFTHERIKRHKDVLARYARGQWERLAFANLQFLPSNLAASDIPGGERRTQSLTSLSGSLYVRLGLEMPGEGEIAAEIDAATDTKVTAERIDLLYRRAFGYFTYYLPVPLLRIISTMVKATPEARNRYFQQEIAPHMARRFVDDLRLHDAGGIDLGADFTLAGEYAYGRVVQVDFTLDLDGRDITRKDLEQLKITFDDKFRKFAEGAANPERFLPPRSFMDVTRAVLRYANDHYEDQAWSDRGARDLVNSVSGHAEPEGALCRFKPSHADKRNMHALLEDAYADFKARLEAHPFFYHKAIWWHMDRDELYTLLDGFSFDEAGGRSLASIIERRPLGILGNTLVFKTSTDKPLDPMFASFEALKNHYVAGLPPRDPIRISLPTDGLYARAHMDGCIAAEEHNGSFDWVFNNQEPELADLPSSLLESRSAQAPNLAPTAFPDTIINLQNAPAMPAPSGLDGALRAVQNAGAFRDMAGLAGTQANTRAGLSAAAGLATSFGGMAFQGAMAQLQADANAGSDLKGMFSAIEKARDSGLITQEQASEAASEAIKRRMHGKDDVEEAHRREIEKTAMQGDGGGTVTKTTREGTTETVIKEPAPKPEETKAAKPAAKPVGHVRWLEGARGMQDLLLYNFEIGKDALHPDHEKALRQVSVQIKGVVDIDGVEGRASATKARSGDEERQNTALSQRRMERVWLALMEYAYDPQSNLDKQLIKSDAQPIRDRYSASLDNIPRGTGDEDPVERSVLIRLARPVQPDIQPIPVPAPKKPGLPVVRTLGHAVQIQMPTGDQATMVNQNGQTNVFVDGSRKTLVDGDQIFGGDNALKVEIDGDDNAVSLASVNNMVIFNINLMGNFDPGGTPAKVALESQATRQWDITLKNPQVSGSGLDEILNLVKDALEVLKNVSETLPKLAGETDVALSIPGLAEGKVTISASDFNPGATIAEFFSEVAIRFTNPANSVGKTLAALKIGTVSVDVVIAALSEAAPDDSDASVSRDGTISGKGMYFAREYDVTSTAPEIIAAFRYVTDTPVRLGAWKMDGLRDASVQFWRGAVFEDLSAGLEFLTDLSALLAPGALRDLVPDKAVTLIDEALDRVRSAGRLASSGEGVIFKPGGQAAKEVSPIYVGRSLTAFEMKGLIT